MSGLTDMVLETVYALPVGGDADGPATPNARWLVYRRALIPSAGNRLDQQVHTQTPSDVSNRWRSLTLTQQGTL